MGEQKCGVAVHAAVEAMASMDREARYIDNRSRFSTEKMEARSDPWPVPERIVPSLLRRRTKRDSSFRRVDVKNLSRSLTVLHGDVRGADVD